MLKGERVPEEGGEGMTSHSVKEIREMKQEAAHEIARAVVKLAEKSGVPVLSVSLKVLHHKTNGKIDQTIVSLVDIELERI
jgi:lysophospholipid acyltransferase (LPLAT)-like uncharacterized protein